MKQKQGQVSQPDAPNSSDTLVDGGNPLAGSPTPALYRRKLDSFRTMPVSVAQQPESQAELARILTDHAYWVQSIVDPSAQIRGRRANFAGSDLRRFDFTGRVCRGVDFSGADLRDVKFTGADLALARFVNADLRGSDLSGANVRHADLTGADLSGTNVNGAVMR